MEPIEKFTRRIERYRDGMVEGFNRTIRVIQRCDYGLRDEAYRGLKLWIRILT